MSLNDMFNPNDGSFIDKFDNTMIRLHKKLGDLWQNKTHKSVDSLKKGMYGASATTFGAYCAMAPDYLMILPALNCAKRAVVSGGTCPKTSLESEIQSEAAGMPQKTWKYMNAGLLGCGIVGILTSSTRIVVGAVSGDQESLKNGIALLSLSIGALSWCSGNYLHQTDFDPPPPKPKKKPVLERIKDKVGGLLPEPTLQPVPVQSYAIAGNYAKNIQIMGDAS